MSTAPRRKTTRRARKSAAVPAPPTPRLVPAAAVPDDAERGARHEHFLRSLLELSRELSVAMDLHGAADVLLYNLMGQLGTARSALWLSHAGSPGPPVLVRCHGFRSRALEALFEASHEALLRETATSHAPLLAWRLREHVGPSEFELMRQLDAALFAPLHGNGQFLGLLAIGSRVDGRPYAAADLESLETALGMVGIALQNTRLYNRVRENNRQLRITNDRLLEFDRLKSEFLSNVNHELRTPLAVVIAGLECLIESTFVDPQGRSLLEGALEKSRQLRGLIENLLALSDAAEDRLDVRLTEGDLGAVLDELQAERRAGITEALREFSYVRGDLPRARYDRRRLLQILNELLDNSVKFTRPGCRIALEAAVVRVEERDWIHVTVRDDGPGIAPERLASVFRTFEQGDGSATRRVGGLGVGLAFARELAMRTGCVLEVRSERGTQCLLRVPVVAAAGATHSAP